MNADAGVPRVPAAHVDTARMPTLDVRRHPGKEQIRGAVRYDAHALLNETPLTLPFAHDSTIVVYADDEQTALRVAVRLRQEGYRNAAVLDGGFEAYRNAGLPTEEITQEQPVPGTERGIPRA